MVRGSDGALAAEIPAHAPVLREGAAVALDRCRVRAGGLVDIVGGTVAFDGANGGQPRAGVVVSVVLDDVVFDERAGRPSVYGEVTVAVWGECPSEFDGPLSSVRSGIPCFTK